MSEFTKGKWQPYHISGICMGVEVADETIPGYSQVICNSILPETDKEYKSEKKEIIANITLMAAAPELLKALQKVYRLAKQVGLDEDLDFEENDYIGNAIKKALGE